MLRHQQYIDFIAFWLVVEIPVWQAYYEKDRRVRLEKYDSKRDHDAESKANNFTSTNSSVDK